MYFNEWCKMAIHYSPHVVFSPCIFCVWPKLAFFPSDPKKTRFLHRNPSVPPLILGFPRLEWENGNSSPNASCPAVGWMAWFYRILAFLPPWMYHQIVPAGKVHKELLKCTCEKSQRQVDRYGWLHKSSDDIYIYIYMYLYKLYKL